MSRNRSVTHKILYFFCSKYCEIHSRWRSVTMFLRPAKLFMLLSNSVCGVCNDLLTSASWPTRAATSKDADIFFFRAAADDCLWRSISEIIQLDTWLTLIHTFLIRSYSKVRSVQTLNIHDGATAEKSQKRQCLFSFLNTIRRIFSSMCL